MNITQLDQAASVKRMMFHESFHELSEIIHTLPACIEKTNALGRLYEAEQWVDRVIHVEQEIQYEKSKRPEGTHFPARIPPKPEQKNVQG